MMGVRDQGRRGMSPTNMGDLDGGLPRVRRRNSSVDSSGEARKRRRGSPGSRNDGYEPSVPRRSSYGGGRASGSRDYGGGGGRDYGVHSSNYGNGYSTSPPPAAPYSSSGRPPAPGGLPFGNKSRRLYVGNLPFNVGLTEQALVQFFSAMYVAAFRPQKSPAEVLPCGSVWLRSDGNFGFIELRGDQEAINMMQLNGIFLHGRPLRINRPSDYNAENNNMAPEQINVTGVEELCAQLQGIVAPPADLRANNPNFTPKEEKNKKQDVPVLKPLSNGMGNGNINNNNKAESKPAENIIIAPPQRAAPAIVIPKSEPKRDLTNANVNGVSNGNGNSNSVLQESKSEGEPSVESKSDRVSGEDKPSGGMHGNVISLVNLVTDKDLDGTAEEYEDLVDDVKTECGQYGTVVAVEIPRNGPWRSTAFVEYTQKEHALAAVNALRARVFEGMKIAAQVVTACKTAKDAVQRTK